MGSFTRLVAVFVFVLIFGFSNFDFRLLGRTYGRTDVRTVGLDGQMDSLCVSEKCFGHHRADDQTCLNMLFEFQCVCSSFNVTFEFILY